MIRFERVSVTYAPGDGEVHAEPALHGVDLTVPEGELCLLVGPSGVGKSTLLGTVSGLVPHFTGGTLHGRVTVAGRDTRSHKPRELADVVGSVGQDPLAHFVTDTVEDELAYGMESIGLPRDVMRRRVEETLDLLGLATLRDRPISTLSGGQQQRVAIGSVLTPHPKVLVLDEPTSALDPGAAEEVLAVLQRLVHDLGTTVLMAEHRLERVVQYADQVLLLPAPGSPPRLGPPQEVMAESPVRPPVVALGALAGWSPLPLSVRDARRRAAQLREQLGRCDGPATASRTGDGFAVRAEDLTVRRGRGDVLHKVELAVRPGETVALMGRNGAGKSTLLNTLVGMHQPASGSVRLGPAGRTGDGPAGTTTAPTGPAGAAGPAEPTEATGTDPASGDGPRACAGLLRRVLGRDRRALGRAEAETSATAVAPHRTEPAQLLRHVGLVPQEPRDLLHADTVAGECTAADQDAGAPPGSCRTLVTRLLPHVPDDTHPRDLSEGQRLALALAVILTAAPPLLLLDEPTRGLDYAAKARLVEILRELAAEGRAIVLATHDVELAAELTQRVIVIAEGEIVADGPAHEVVTASPTFAPQVAKVLAPNRWLTVPQVRAALGSYAGAAE